MVQETSTKFNLSSKIKLLSSIAYSPIKLTQISLTNECGLKCSSCSLSEQEINNPTSLGTVHAGELIRHLYSNWGARLFNFSGFPGNPTNSKNLVSILKNIAKVGIRVSITTNINKLDPVLIETLAKTNGVYAIIMSYHGGDLDKYLFLGKIMMNPQQRRTPKMQAYFNYILTSKDKPEKVLWIADQVMRSGIGYELIFPVIKGDTFSSKNSSMIPSLETSNSIIKGLQKLHQKYLWSGNINGFLALKRPYRVLKKAENSYFENSFHCNPDTTNFITIGPGGNMYPCQELVHGEGLDPLKFGSLEQLIRSDEFKTKIVLPRENCGGCGYGCYISVDTGLNKSMSWILPALSIIKNT